jgi:hypothetical protein
VSWNASSGGGGGGGGWSGGEGKESSAMAPGDLQGERLRGRQPRSGVEVWKLRSGGGGGSGECGCALRRAVAADVRCGGNERAPARMPAVESRNWL